jgi:O-antigen ligase
MSAQMSVGSLTEQNLRASLRFDWFDKIAAGAVLVLVLYVGRTENLIWVPFLVGGLVGTVVMLIRWPSSALLELMVAAAVPRWFGKIGTLNVKPEHVVAAALCGILLVRICTRSHKFERFEKADILLLGFLLTNYISSSLYSPDVPSTMRWALLQTVAATPYFLIRQLVRTKQQLAKVMTWYLWIGAGAAIYGILCFIGFVYFGTLAGITIFFYMGYIAGVHGTLWEPNIFGSYCACYGVMYLYYYLARIDGRKHRWYLAGLVATLIGISLSLARQGWVCLIFVGGMILLFSLRRRRVQRKRLVLVVLGLSGALALAILAMSTEESDRLANQVDQDPTVMRRAGLVALAMDDIEEHPIVGLGSSSFQLLYIGEDDSYQGVGDAWLGTLAFRILHDTGLLGSVFLGWFVLNLARRVWRVQRQRTSKDLAVGALSAGAVVMLIAYQLTDASTLAFTWVHLGLLTTAIRLAEATPADQDEIAQFPHPESSGAPRVGDMTFEGAG